MEWIKVLMDGLSIGVILGVLLFISGWVMITFKSKSPLVWSPVLTLALIFILSPKLVKVVFADGTELSLLENCENERIISEKSVNVELAKKDEKILQTSRANIKLRSMLPSNNRWWISVDNRNTQIEKINDEIRKNRDNTEGEEARLAELKTAQIKLYETKIQENSDTLVSKYSKETIEKMDTRRNILIGR